MKQELADYLNKETEKLKAEQRRLREIEARMEAKWKIKCYAVPRPERGIITVHIEDGREIEVFSL